MTDEYNPYLIYSMTDETEYSIESENNELQALATILADDSRDRPGYSDRWPGDDPKAHPRGAYYIEDKNTLDRLAKDYNETICDINYNEPTSSINP
jgi:hypothetical protein